MRPGLLPWRSRRDRPSAPVPLPAAWYEVAYADPGCRDVPVPVTDEESALDTRGLPVLGAAARVPAAADAAQAPVSRLRGTGDVRAAARRYPDGVSPLPVAVTSGSSLRPRRLLHPDGTPLTCRPGGRSGDRWAGVADGIVPASGPNAGWLQLIRRKGADNLAVPIALHPALVSPEGVDPYRCMTRRQRRRFAIFDVAEADGQDAAELPAALIDVGDFITSCGRDDILQIGQAALSCGPLGVSVRLIGDYLGGAETDMLVLRGTDPVRIMLPAVHPAEDGPQARCLFAPDPGRPRRAIQVQGPILLWDGSR